MSDAGGLPAISVVVPVVERYDDVRQLHHELVTELRKTGESFEFIFVVDGSQRSVVPTLRALKETNPEWISVIVLGKVFGESAALAIGLEWAKGQTVVTHAAYFQVEFQGLGRALEMLERDEADLVIGRRFPRVDSGLNRIQSWIFHRLVGFTTGAHFHDISCGFRVMKRRVAGELNLYGDLHRFLPILALGRGFRVQELPLPQRTEDTKTRYHGFGIYLRRVLDILTIFFLVRFTRKPLRFFGVFGAGLFGLGFVAGAYLTLYKFITKSAIADRPLLLLAVLLLVLGVQSVSIGLLGEIIIFTHAREVREYEIAEIV